MLTPTMRALDTGMAVKKAGKPKCPHCGSSDYALMPSDFETAKCKDCGKNWDHGIVPGINDPGEITKSNPTPGDFAAMMERNKKRKQGLKLQPSPMDMAAISSQIAAANS